MVLSISEERYEDFQKETIVYPELQTVLTMERCKTLLDIQ